MLQNPNQDIFGPHFLKLSAAQVREGLQSETVIIISLQNKRIDANTSYRRDKLTELPSWYKELFKITKQGDVPVLIGTSGADHIVSTEESMHILGGLLEWFLKQNAEVNSSNLQKTSKAFFDEFWKNPLKIKPEN